MTNSVYSFWHNFEPVYSVKEQDSPSFYVNPFTLDIHDAHSLYGFSWRCVYVCLKILTGHDYESEAINAWIGFIKKSWKNASLQIRNAIEFYKTAFSDSQKRELDSVRDVIAISEQSMQFLDFLTKEQLTQNIIKVQNVCLKVFHEEFFNQEDIALLQNLRSAYAACCCEGIIQHPMPVSIFRKLIAETVLEEIENEILDDWILAIERSPIFISSLLLHRALHLVVENQNELGALELSLIKKGMNRLCASDPIWDNYLYAICPGSYLYQEIILGERRYNRVLSQQQLDMYAQKQSEHQYVLVGTAPTSLVRFLAQGMKQFLIPMIAFTVCGGSGCIAVTEPIEQMLESLHWTATKDTFDQKQLVFANEISSFMARCMQNNKMPYEQSLSSFAITRSGKLVTLAPIVESNCFELEYDALEKFVKEVSCNNIFVFYYIMATSKLHEHPEAINQRQKMKRTIFEHTEIDVFDSAVWYVFLFYTHFNELRSQILPAHRDELKAVLADKLIEILQNYGIAATEWKNPVAQIYKESLAEIIHSFSQDKQSNSNTPLFQNWYHN